MSHRLQVLIPEALESRLGKAAARAGVSKGEWVRRAIERGLAEPADVADPLDQLARLEAPTADIGQMLAEIESGRG